MQEDGSGARLAAVSYELLAMFSMLFGIPLSFLSLITGTLLAVRSKWGLFRYAWVAAKLLAILTVIGVGAFVIGPQTEAMQQGGGSTALLIAFSAYDVIVLTTATGLSVFKPRRRLRAA